MAWPLRRAGEGILEQDGRLRSDSAGVLWRAASLGDFFFCVHGSCAQLCLLSGLCLSGGVAESMSVVAALHVAVFLFLWALFLVVISCGGSCTDRTVCVCVCITS